jgi:hypothetical protein
MRSVLPLFGRTLLFRVAEMRATARKEKALTLREGQGPSYAVCSGQEARSEPKLGLNRAHYLGPLLARPDHGRGRG